MAIIQHKALLSLAYSVIASLKQYRAVKN